MTSIVLCLLLTKHDNIASNTKLYVLETLVVVGALALLAKFCKKPFRTIKISAFYIS